MTLPPNVPSSKALLLAATPVPLTAAGAVYAHLPLALPLTLGWLVAAVAMIALAVKASLSAAAAERAGFEGIAGRAYDAVHDQAMIADISPDEQGSAVLELVYRSRQIVFLDEQGTPTSAVTSGPGSVQLIASTAGRHGWRRFAKLRRDRRALTITERGVQTDAGRIVRECVLVAEDGARPFDAEMAASTSFPAS
ncbi:MAG: hypothetical protein ABI140_18230 [Jatrophihabitantaceae bacterium]